MKKIFIFLLALVASVTMFAAVTIDRIAYNLDETNLTAEVTRNGNYSGSIVIPSSVTYNNTTYIVTSIGWSAFFGRSNLTSIVIPNSVTSIDSNAFYGCQSLTSVTIGNSVISIGTQAFYQCISLTSLTIGNSVTNIRNFAFASCSSLTSITIPNSVTNIESEAFSNCSGLTSIIVEEGNPTYDNRDKCNAIIETATNTIIAGCQSTVIPNSVTSIGGYAFRGCSSLKSISIPNSVTTIVSHAFLDCTGLTSVTIGNSVTSIGYGAFLNCTGLTSIFIPNSVTSIGDYAFSNCSGLTSITVEEGNPTYDNRDKCNAIIETATNTIIAGCQSTIIPNSVTSIGESAFGGCSGLTSIDIPNSVTSIGDYAFSNCSSLTSIEIPNSVTSIGCNAFYGGSSLTSVTIPNSVTSIGNYAFFGCSSLTSVTIPNSVTGIGYGAFRDCSSLTSITCEAVTPPTLVLGDKVFYDVDKSIPLYVPYKSIDAYKAAEEWKDFTNILPISGTEPTKYTITWLDENGNVIKTDEVAEGETPEYVGDTPTKAATEEYTYEFAGWLPRIKPATEDVRYITFFERNKIETPKYTVNINGANCSLRISNELPAGTTLQVEAVADECFQFEKWSDGEMENPRTINVTEDADLTAEFNKLQYTITGKAETEGGKVNIIKK